MERAVEPRPVIFALVLRWWPTALAVLAVALVAWPFGAVTPGVDADWNWFAAIAVAAKDGMRFGDQLVWTYGPLGFLVNGSWLYYGDVALLALAYQWVVQILLAGTLFLALRRSYAVPIAFAVAAVVTVLVPDRVFALGLAWCVLALARADDAPRSRLVAAFAPASGVLVGVAALGKLNQGIGLTVLVLVALVARPGRSGRDAATFVGAALATAAAGWFATGQTLADVWPYLRNGRELVSGYAAAMGMRLELPWTTWGAALVAALSLVLVLDVARGARPRRRLGLLAVWAIYTFIAWKQSFVRHGGGLFFPDMLMLLAIVPVLRARRAFALASTAATVVIAAASFGAFDLQTRLDPYRNAKAAVDQARLIVSRDRRGSVKSSLREAIVSHYAFPQAFVERVGRDPLAFWPYSYGDLVYAYDFNWRPVPVLEPYAAYTSALDRLDAEMLASDRAPAWIVRSNSGGLDNRVATFEAPLATLAILCRYRPLGTEGQWQLLARGVSRCGAMRVLHTVEARWGEPVAVPASRSDALLLVRVDGAEPSGRERLRAAWLKPDAREIALDGAVHRLVAATARDGLLLRAPVVSDYAAPFSMAPNPATIAVGREGGNPGGTLRYTFVAVPIRPLPPALSAGR